MTQRNSKDWAWLRALKRARRAGETLLHAVGDAAQGPIGTRHLETPGEIVEGKTKKEQVFEWLNQRQAYVDDAFNGRVQTVAEMKAEMTRDIMLGPYDPKNVPEHSEYAWDDARGEFVPKKP